jgi:hypothetical protein
MHHAIGVCRSQWPDGVEVNRTPTATATTPVSQPIRCLLGQSFRPTLPPQTWDPSEVHDPENEKEGHQHRAAAKTIEATREPAGASREARHD